MLKKILSNLYKKITNKFIPNYSIELENAINGSKTLLDVGCGSNSPIAPFSHKFHAIGVDAFLPSIEKSRQTNIHSEYHQIDVLDIDKSFDDKSIDCVLASDLIEHLTKEDGYKLIEKMEKIASKRIIIFTPNGFLEQGVYDNNPWQLHLSGWTVKEMQKMGYHVIGIGGWKPLRGEYAGIRYKPKFFWTMISDLSRFFVRNKPEYAFQILCIKYKS